MSPFAYAFVVLTKLLKLPEIYPFKRVLLNELRLLMTDVRLLSPFLALPPIVLTITPSPKGIQTLIWFKVALLRKAPKLS